jgi:hypothetical protein
MTGLVQLRFTTPELLTADLAASPYCLSFFGNFPTFTKWLTRPILFMLQNLVLTSIHLDSGWNRIWPQCT